METSRNIIDLPVELIDRIFKNLEESDQCHLAHSHPFLRNCFIYHVGNRYSNVISSLCFKNWKTILPVCGSTVHHIVEEFHILDESLMRLIEQHCINLESIQIGINRRNYRRVKTFLDNLKSLSSIIFKANFKFWPTGTSSHNY
ncbi:uncharacterized protein LOC121530010 isoform X2 [Drosophila eugracilis]|uniref:uncharacterized protein LOC121530010 isoform X2 n=1 Tax=Drosophila eugracilis TaxID=29029 RepID=UPI001BD9A07A|nr:uncharacterized protein LOC121530010 isoform X2 [Drosophila eugracilis]